MLRERLTWLRLIHAAMDVFALLATLVVVAWLRALVGAWWPYDVVPDTVVLQKVSVADQLRLGWMLVPAWLLVLAWRGRYSALLVGPEGQRLIRTLGSSALALFAFLGVVFLLRIDTVSRTVVTGFSVVAVPVLWGSYALARQVTRAVRPSVRVRVIGPTDAARDFADEVARHREWGIALVDATHRVQDDSVDGVDEVVVVGDLPSADLSRLAGMCEDRGVALSVQANFLGTRIARASVRDLGDTALLTFTSTPTRTTELAVKRVFDVVASLVALVGVAPLMALLALAIRLEDGGPALFVQERVGRYGRRFPMLKFRTMRVGADDEQPALQGHNRLVGPAFKLDSDPRVTRVGWWLRRTSLDELPQLVNILRGEMSLVGPRPPLVAEVAAYGPGQQRRLSMRPGLTGLWQVTARDEPDVSRWIALDLQYIDHWTLLGDLGLIVRTLPAVLIGRGAR